MEEGPECCRREEWPTGRRLERATALVPLLLNGFDTIRQGGPTRTSDAAVPRPGFS
jgi:hypothetical protein